MSCEHTIPTEFNNLYSFYCTMRIYSEWGNVLDMYTSVGRWSMKV